MDNYKSCPFQWSLIGQCDKCNLCKSIPLPIPEKYLGIQGGKIKYVVECIKQKYFPKEAKTITIEKSLLIDIVKQIDKCFRDYVRQHIDRDIPCNLDVLLNSIVSNIEKIFEEAG